MSRPVRILLNDPLVSRERGGGVGRYVRRLAEGLAARCGDNLVLYSAESLAPGSAARQEPSRELPAGRLLALHGRRLPGLVRRHGIDVVFAPYFGAVAAPVPEVFTIHDLTYFTYPPRRSWRGIMEERVRREQAACFRRGAALVAVSEATRRDLLARFPEVPAERVVVVHHGVDRVFLDGPPRPRQAAGRPVFLFVGKRAGYKNFALLLEAWRIAGLGRSAELRVTAPPTDTWSETEQEGIRLAGLGDAARLVHAPDDAALREEYAAATALVYPSSNEGFGLPLLEAMASGTLVVCSSSTSLPEVGGDVPFYHDARSAEQLAARLKEVLALGPADRARRIEAGRARARGFDWSVAVDRTLAVLEAAAGR